MTAPRKECALQTQMSVYVTKCVLLAYRAQVFQHTVLRQLLAVDKVMKSARDPAMDTRSATCMSPGTAEFRISELMLFSTPHQTSSIVLQPGGCRRCGATFVPQSCVMSYLFNKIVVGHEMIVKCLSKWWQQLSLAETLPRLPASLLT